MIFFISINYVSTFYHLEQFGHIQDDIGELDGLEHLYVRPRTEEEARNDEKLVKRWLEESAELARRERERDQMQRAENTAVSQEGYPVVGASVSAHPEHAPSSVSNESGMRYLSGLSTL